MFNLIPKQEQKRLKREYYLRLGTVVLFVFFLVMGVGAVLLIPSWVVVKWEQSSLEEELAILEATIEAGGGNEARMLLTQTDLQTQLIDTFKDRIMVTDMIERTVQTLGDNVHMRSFTFSEESDRITVRLRGEADNRTALIAFTETLKQDPAVADVVLPLKDLASSSDIPFTVTIELAS